MRILALNPFHGGSHQAFLEGWVRHSQHEFTVLSLPATRWKWRMRHAAFTFAEEVQQRFQAGERWDGLFATDMLNLAEFLGLARAAASQLPAVLYFHENQLTYPVQQHDPRDLHFAFTNYVSAVAADALWFNTAWHQNTLLEALKHLLRRMPDRRNPASVKQLREKSAAQSPGIEPGPGCEYQSEEQTRRLDSPSPLRIVWAARWEHDKQPELLFAACRRLKEQQFPFRLTVLGESTRTVPPCFEEARGEFSGEIDHWGFVESSAGYRRLLAAGDVIVSTALHEFFGIAVVEAAAAGCLPVVPRALAYPEVLGDRWPLFHDGTADGLVVTLKAAAAAVSGASLSPPDVSRYFWQNRAAGLDAALSAVVSRRACGGKQNLPEISPADGASR